MEQVVRVARTLRVDHQFRGYIHLKTIPEASPELIAEAGKWADRLSINVELPTQNDLKALAPEKNLSRIEGSMTKIKSWIDQSKAERRESPKAPVFAPAGQSTQMIVGATPANDATILQRASSLYRMQRLRRVYYSAFSPIPSELVYSITGGTGAYANLKGYGIAAFTFSPGTTTPGHAATGSYTLKFS